MNHVGTAAPGCPAKRSSAGFYYSANRLHANLRDIHISAILLQHVRIILTTLTCSSNRESLRTVSGGSGLSFLFPGQFRKPAILFFRQLTIVNPSCIILNFTSKK
jgi:hypothetical protein